MDSSNSSSYQPINVSTNGVKRVVIPCKGYGVSTSSQNPVGTFSLPSSTAIFVTALPCSPTVGQGAAAAATVSYVAAPGTVGGIRASTLRPTAVFGSTPKPSSPLSSMRFPLASRYPNKTVLAVRPKPLAPPLQPPLNQNTTTLVCTSAQSIGLPIVRPTGIVTSIPAFQVVQAKPAHPSTINSAGKGISVITTARVIPQFSQPVFQSPLTTLNVIGNQSFRTFLPAKSIVRHITPTIIQPPTAVVSPVRSLKKTVTIKMPGSPNSIAASNVRMSQTKYALVEMMEGGKKVMRCIQLSNVDDGPTKREEVSEQMAEEQEQAENPVSDDLKVIEIVPDDDSEDESGEHDRSIAPDERVRKEEDTANSPPSGLVHAGTIHENVHSSPASHGSRPGIFETLKSMSVEEASAAVAALNVLHNDPNTMGSDPKYNIVHRGDDHLIIENPGYDDDAEDDDDSTVSCGEESVLILTEPNTRLHTPEPAPLRNTTSDALSEIRAAALSLRNRSAVKGKNVAKRTGGRPRGVVPSKNRAKRTGGRPMTNRERYGVDIKECRVSLENLYNTKSRVRWVQRHLFHILCCVNGQPGMRLKRLKKQRAGQLERPIIDISPEIPKFRKTRGKWQTRKAGGIYGYPDDSWAGDDMTVDSSDVSDMTYMTEELTGEVKPAIEELISSVTETAVVKEEKRIGRSPRKRQRMVSGKSDIIIKKIGEESFVAFSATEADEKFKTDGNLKTDEKFKMDEKVKTGKKVKRNKKVKAEKVLKIDEKLKAEEKIDEKLKIEEELKMDEELKTGDKLKPPRVRKRRGGGRKGSGRRSLSSAKASPIASGDNAIPTSELSHEMHQITYDEEDIQMPTLTDFLPQSHLPRVSSAGSLTIATEGGKMSPPASRVSVAASGLGLHVPCSASFSGVSSVGPTFARNIVSASEAVQKLIERSPTCSSSQLGAGHFIATRSDGRTLLIRRTENNSKSNLASPSKGKYYLVKTDQKAYLVPIDKVQVQQTSKSEKLKLVPSATSGAAGHTSSLSASSVSSRQSSPSTAVPRASSDAWGAEDTAEARSTQSPETPRTDYEPAVAGMRQEDRISLLKEKLRQQQQKVEQMRKSKG